MMSDSSMKTLAEVRKILRDNKIDYVVTGQDEGLVKINLLVKEEEK